MSFLRTPPSENGSKRLLELLEDDADLSDDGRKRHKTRTSPEPFRMYCHVKNCPSCNSRSLENIKANNDVLMSKIGILQSSISEFNKRMDSCELRITSYDSQMQILVDTVANNNEVNDSKINEISLKVDNQDDKLQKEICHIQGLQKQDELIINGIPHDNKENLKLIMIKIAAALEINITSDVIRKIHRLGPQNEEVIAIPPRNKPIMVKFATIDIRNSINENYVKLIREKRPFTLQDIGHSSNERIYINSHLPQCLTSLYKQALDMKKLNRIQAVHAKMNSVAIKLDDKWHKVQTKKELASLMDEHNKVGHLTGA